MYIGYKEQTSKRENKGLNTMKIGMSCIYLNYTAINDLTICVLVYVVYPVANEEDVVRKAISLMWGGLTQ